MLNSKSFRNFRNVPPYNKPKTKITNRYNNKVSIFNKFKSLINKSFHSIKSVNEGRKPIEPNSKNEPQNVNTPIDVPGGFFKESNTEPILVSCPQINDDVSVKQKNEETSLVNLSNAKLADFFAHRGDKPLNEIEFEGVMSLLRKSSMPQLSNHDKNDIFNSTFNSSFQDNNHNSVHFHNDSNKIFNRSRILSTSSNFIGDNSINDDDNDVGNTTIKGLKVPQYVPNFDPLTNTTTTTTSNGPNSRVSSISSNKSSVRRVFNYSGVKSPYRNTVIFKYPSNYRSISASNNVKPQSQQMKAVTKLSPTKKVNQQKLTNVASALVTLLESNNNSDINNNNNKTGTKEENDTLIISQESKDLANPYSSIIRKPRQQNQSINLEKTNDLKSETKQTIFEKTPTVVNTTTTDTTNNNKDNNNNNNTSTVTSTNTYKPIKLSSSITNGVVAETVDQKDISEPKEKVKETKQTYIPQTSSFTFTFGKKNVNMEDTETKNNNNRTTLSPSDASITPSSTTDKDSSKLNTSTSTAFNVGKLEEKTNEYQYTFPTPTKSNIDTSTIDESKVDHFKSMFVF